MGKRHVDRIGRAGRLLPLGAAVLLAACQAIPPAAPPPAPPPPPVAPPSLPPPPPPTEPQQPWDVAPLSPGDWRYEAAGRDSQARYGPPSASPVVALRCIYASRQIELWIEGAASGPNVAVTIQTSAGPLAWTGSGDGTSIRVQRPASDPGFDWIAFSRGRVSLEVAGLARLVLPVWSEMQRVIEDCRG